MKNALNSFVRPSSNVELTSVENNANEQKLANIICIRFRACQLSSTFELGLSSLFIHGLIDS